MGKNLKINPDIGIFITTDPNYAGRSTLPPNLTKLFGPKAMARLNRELVAHAMLFSQGFRTAEVVAFRIVPFFNLCGGQLPPQPHNDFGLLALKVVLSSADISGQIILIQSVAETIVPKLAADDTPLLTRQATI